MSMNGLKVAQACGRPVFMLVHLDDITNNINTIRKKLKNPKTGECDTAYMIMYTLHVAMTEAIFSKDRTAIMNMHELQLQSLCTFSLSPSLGYQ